MKSITTIVAVLIVATCGIVAQEVCPRGAEFIISYDNVVPLADFFENIPDPNLTFFRDVLQFTEQEIEAATHSAIEYFNTTFGLDFSESVPNEQGQRVFQNSSFYAAKVPVNYTAKANRWLVNRNTKSRCFDVRVGWFGVQFLDNQVLYGTYGGTEGRMVAPSSFTVINWLYTWINTRPQSPLVIQMQSTIPAYFTPDGVGHEIFAVFHHGLGSGIGLETLFINPLPPDQRFGRLTFYNGIIFPADKFP